MSDDVAKATVDRIKAAMAPKGPDPAAMAPAAPVVPAAPADGGRPRDEKGQFIPAQPVVTDPVVPAKPEPTQAERGLLAAVRAEREKRKELEAKLRALETKPASVEAPRPSKRDELLKTAPEDTQKFWKQVGDPVVRETIEEEVRRILEPHKPALEAAAASRTREAEVREFATDLQEFVEDMALEGVQVDPNTLVNTIQKFETQYQISLGPNNAVKFRNALGMLGGSAAGAKPAGETPEQVKARAEKEAADKARAGGVAPGSSPTAPPPDYRETLQRTTREAAGKGDLNTIAKLIAQRVPKHDLLRR